MVPNVLTDSHTVAWEYNQCLLWWIQTRKEYKLNGSSTRWNWLFRREIQSCPISYSRTYLKWNEFLSKFLAFIGWWTTNWKQNKISTAHIGTTYYNRIWITETHICMDLHTHKERWSHHYSNLQKTIV